MKYFMKMVYLLLTVIFTNVCYASYTLTAKDVIFENGVIKKYIGMAKDIIIPDNFNGEKVTVIGDYSFNRGVSLMNVKLPNSIEIIGRSAFRGSALQTIVIPKSVTSLGPLSFCQNHLKSIILPQNIKSIGRSAFNCNSINQINGVSSDGIIFQRNEDGSEDSSTIVSYGGAKKCIDFIPSSVRKIEQWAFIFCRLEKVVIPDGVTHVMQRAFYYNGITELEIADSVIHISGGAFTGNRVTVLNGKSSDGIIFGRKVDGDEDFTKLASYAGNKTRLVMPDTVKSVESEAFYGCNLVDVVFSKNLKRIERQAFHNTDLTSIDLPHGVTHIGLYAFFFNKKMKSITLPNTLVFIDRGAFNGSNISVINDQPSDGFIYRRNADGSVDYKTVVSYGGGKKVFDFIPENVEAIGEHAFWNCSFDKVVIPKNIKSIGKCAFAEGYLNKKLIHTPISLPTEDMNNNPVCWMNSKNERVSTISNYYLAYKSFPVLGSFTVKYDSNGGIDGAVVTENVVSGGFSQLVAKPTRTGFDLVGWNSSPDGYGIDLTESVALTENITVYAKWKSIFDDSDTIVAVTETSQNEISIGKDGSVITGGSSGKGSVDKGYGDELFKPDFTLDMDWNLAYVPENMLDLWYNDDFRNNEFWVYLEGDPFLGEAKYRKLDEGEIPALGEGLWIVNTKGEKQEYKVDVSKLLSSDSPEIQLFEGWNIIGVEKALPLKWTATELWEWSSELQDYQKYISGNKLIPTYGYWIYMKGPGYILEEDPSGTYYIIH